MTKQGKMGQLSMLQFSLADDLLQSFHKQSLLFQSLSSRMWQNKWFENPLLNGIEKTDGPVFELIISAKLENFPSLQAVGKSRILLIIFLCALSSLDNIDLP